MRSLLRAPALALFAVSASAHPSGVMGTRLTASGVGQAKIGMPLIWGFKATSDPGTFESGQIYNGENGKTYSANISLQADGKLRLRGYVGSPMLGETQLWTRVSQ